MTEIIRLDNVSKFYRGGVRAVEDVSLSIAAGEFVTLLGPSGCGKTTTLRMIAGFEDVTAGRIHLAGEDVTDLPAYKRNQINTVFQDYALFPHLTVEQNVGYGLRVNGAAADQAKVQVHDALTTVGLLDRAQMRPNQLSGGQRQRVAVARALVRKPKVLLLDEPLSALDVKLRDAMQVELKHLHEQLGITFVMVTHDQKEALVMSDRVVVMRAGRIVQTGSPTELYDEPASAYVADFVGASNLIKGRAVHSDGRAIELDVGGQMLRGRLAQGAAKPESGSIVSIAIRPERLHVLPDKRVNGSAITLNATLVDRYFLGNVNRLEVRLPGSDLPVSIDLQRYSADAASSLGDINAAIQIAVEPETVIVFPEDDR
jgi:spermidine/putrescine transport system ATP-binding protein